MKPILIFLILWCVAGSALAQQKPDQGWIDQKYSMFIHWGLYSELGGVWRGQPVTRGYSEQIQSHGGIFSDWYAAVADNFNPVNWDADAIVRLAVDAGMKSIVFTSKHHDGFCMYHSRYTDFNIVDATPFGRDVMKELSDACARHGIRFAVYYSLIDWHFPEAYPISSHNADAVTDAHHAYSMKQVEEIMTGYGPISEIWFDMGSLRAKQSKELYDLVTRLQPQCMVSGRLGNDRGDFAVMSDNAYPEHKIGVPWQTPASFFDETWSYRSWQERGDVHDKIKEKIRSLINVISRGGNYLLNIGPRGDGSVVEFERDALLEIGRWLKRNGEAIYASQSTPFEHALPFGEVTRKGNNLYLFVNEDYNQPQIALNGIIGRMSQATLLAGGQPLTWKQDKQGICIDLPNDKATDWGYTVIAIEFDGDFRITPERLIKSPMLSTANAIPVYAYSSMDYYSSFRSTVGFNWHFSRNASKLSPSIIYTQGDEGKTVRVTIDGTSRDITLTGGKRKDRYMKPGSVRWKSILHLPPANGRFGPRSIGEDTIIDPATDTHQWREPDYFTPGERYIMAAKEKQSAHFLYEVESDKQQSILVEIGIADGLQVILNGKTLLKRTYTGGVPMKNEIVNLPLQKGTNQLVVKLHNRYGDRIRYTIDPTVEQCDYTLRLDDFTLYPDGVHDVQLELASPPNKNSDIGLRDVRLKLW